MTQPCQYVDWTEPDSHEPICGHPLRIKTSGPCTHVCNDSISLFGPQQNYLVACGSWSTLVSTYEQAVPDKGMYPHIESAPPGVLGAFEAFGLEAAVSQYIRSATNHIDTIGACLVHLYRNDKHTPTSSEGLVV